VIDFFPFTDLLELTTSFAEAFKWILKDRVVVLDEVPSTVHMINPISNIMASV